MQRAPSVPSAKLSPRLPLLCLLLAAACGGSSAEGGAPPGDAPAADPAAAIAQFTASAAQVDFGQPVTLTWSVVGSPDALTLDGADVSGTTSLEVIPRRRQTFTLRATFGATTAERTVTVAARGIDLLAGSPSGLGHADGPRLEARFVQPSAVAVGPDGAAYVSDYATCSIRKIAPDGAVTTLAGNPVACDGADGKGAAGHFRSPYGLSVDAQGNVFVADLAGHTVRKITPAGAVTTLAGLYGKPGAADGAGSGARFSSPTAVLALPDGDVLVADTGNAAIRRVTPAGVVTTAWGVLGSRGSDNSPATPRFDLPTAIARDAAGNLYVTDKCEVRKLATTGTVSLFAGNAAHECGDALGSPTHSYFGALSGIAVDDAGTVFVADGSLRRVVAIDASEARVVAGSRYNLAVATDGPGEIASFAALSSIARMSDGLLATDYYGGTVRRITKDGVVSTWAGQRTLSGGTDGPVGVSRVGWASALVRDGDAIVFADAGEAALRRVSRDGVTTTLAGGNGRGIVDGLGPDARFQDIRGVTSDGEGGCFLSDSGAIRRVKASGEVAWFAGVIGAPPADGPPGKGALGSGGKMIRDEAGALTVADEYGNAIRRVLPDGTITTLAGGKPGHQDGPGKDARFSYPQALAVLPGGDLIVADGQNFVFRRVTPAGDVTTLAGIVGKPGSDDGPPAKATLGVVTDLVVAPSGDVFFVESSSHLVRRMAPDGTVSTVAGQRGLQGTRLGALPGALFRPQAIVLTADGDLVISTNSALVQITAP